MSNLFLRGKKNKQGTTHIFSANLPTRFLLLQLLRHLVTLLAEPDDDITLDRSQRTDSRGARGVCHRTDRDRERRAGGSLAIVSQFTMIEVSLKDEQVGFREVEEEIGCFRVEVPVGEPGAPEWVLFIDPDTPSFVLLNSKERFQLSRTLKLAVRKYTFHLKPSFLSDLSS